MKGFFSMFQNSARELNKIRTLTITGVFVAIYVIIEGFFSIDIMSYIKINFAFVALAVIGMLFGPIVCMSAAILCDILGFLMKPSGGFLIVFTLIAMVSGLIYGVLLYKKEGTRLIISAVIAQFIVAIICNLMLNTLALVHYGFIPKNITSEAMIARVVKNIAEYPIDCIVLVGLLYAVSYAYKLIGQKNRT